MEPTPPRLSAGSPHFKGVYRQNKQSVYDLKKAP